MRIVLAAALLAGIAVPAQAATIVGLYNTGVDAGGNKLAANNAAEQHYTVNGTSTAVTYTHPAYVTAADAVFIAAQPGGGYTGSTNTYELFFDLTGLRASTASLSGKFASDNYAKVYLNGTLIAAQPVGDIGANYNSLTSFAANSGFLSGLNVLRFDVTDLGPPSALLVTGLSGTAAVPEPAEWALLIGGFGFAGMAARRRRQSVRVTFA